MKLCNTFLIIIFVADALRLQESTNLAACVKKTISELFSEDDTLLYIHDGDKSMFPITPTNPQVVASTKNKLAVATGYKHLKYNYIIHHKQFTSPVEALGLAKRSTLWHKRRSTHGTFLLITAVENLKRIFFIFWNLGIVDVVVLVYDAFGNARLYTSDPQAPENQCGMILNTFLTESNCPSPEPIVMPRILRKFTNCKLTYVSTNGKLRSGIKSIEAAWLVLNTFASHLNALNATLVDPTSTLPVFDLFTVKSVYVHNLHDNSTTSSYFAEDFVWIVPSPKQVSTIKTLGLIFTRNVWLLVLFAFIAVSAVWRQLLKHLKGSVDFGEIVLRIFSLTLFGGTHRYERFWTVRFIFIAYVLYSIHIHTAFTSKLMEVLTVPKYESGIKSMHELAQSKMTILVREDFHHAYFKHEASHSTLYNTIKQHLKPLDGNTMADYVLDRSTYQNYALLVQGNYIEMMTKVLLFEPKYIVDNTFLAKLHAVFVGMDQSYVIKTIDKIISILTESGVHDHYIKSVSFRPSIKRQKKKQLENNLTLKHLYFVFLFWFAGMVLALVALVLEIFWHHKNR